MVLAVILTLVIIILLIIILLVLIQTGIIKSSMSQNGLAGNVQNTISLQNGFCDPGTQNNCLGVPVQGDRGQCNLYTTFSKEVEIVDTLTPQPIATIPANYLCDDGFSLALQKYQRNCQQDRCLGQDGKIYTQGQTELLYVDCVDLPACKANRSGVVFNYFIEPNQKITPKASCLVATQGPNATFTSENCEQFNQTAITNATSTTFIYVDQQQLGFGASLIALRAPNRSDCLVSGGTSLTVTPCQTSTNLGFQWMYLPDICENTPGTSTLECFPQQIITRPTVTDLNQIILYVQRRNITQLITLLGNYQSLRGVNNALVLEPYSNSACTNYTPPPNPTLIDDTCAAKTAIIDALVWEQLFNSS